jgi:hypothetical protein
VVKKEFLEVAYSILIKAAMGKIHNIRNNRWNFFLGVQPYTRLIFEKKTKIRLEKRSIIT